MGEKLNVSSIADIGQAVLRRRKQLNLKQMDAAGLVGVGARFLSELERGKETLEIGKVLQVVRGLGLSLILEIPGEKTS